jgi:VanZ family protein
LVVIDSIPGRRAYDVGDLSAAAARYLPPVALMALIFLLSAQPDLNSGLGTWDTILRKLVHMGSYGLLWWLWRRALGRPLLAAAITLAYAATDEWHQSFVQGRHGTPVDVAIDAAGVAIAAALTARYSQPRSVA